MRSRNSVSISAFWCGLARLVNGKAARLRARRMRLETTMSDSGPEPRSHSPVLFVRLSRFIRGFLLSKQITQSGGLFVVLDPDRLAQLLPQRDDLGVPGRAAAAVPGVLAGVTGGAVNPLQKRLQGRLEHLVIVRAAQAALGL